MSNPKQVSQNFETTDGLLAIVIIIIIIVIIKCLVRL